MRRLLLALTLVSVLALVAGIGAARAQTPAPLAWNEAELTWPAPIEFADPGGSLPDPLPSITYTIETLDPGKTEWRVLKVLTQRVYKVGGLSIGVHQWRVSAAWTGDSSGNTSAPTPAVSKEIFPGRLGAPLTLNVR